MCNTPQWLFKIIFWLGYCNSMMNPIIYACSSREFKRAFIRILRCRYRRRRPQLPLPGDVSPPSRTWYAINAGLNKVKGLARRSQKRHADVHKTGRYSLADVNHLENGSPMMSLRMYSFNERGSTLATSTISDDDSAEQVMSEESTSGRWVSPVKVAVSPSGDPTKHNSWADPALYHGTDHSHPLCHANPSNKQSVINDVPTTDIPFTSMAHCIDHCRPKVCSTRGPFLGPPRRTIFLPHRR